MTAMRCYCYCYCYCGNPQGGWSKEKETRTKRRAVGVSPPTRRPLRRVALVVVALLLMQLLPLPCSSWSSSPIPPRTGSRTSSGTPTTPMASSLSFRTRRRRTADAATATAALSSPSKLFIPIIQVLSLQCQLLGINCAEPQEIALTWNEFCERGGATDIHADGWGLAYYSVVVGSSNGNSNNSNSNSNRTNATATSLLPLPSATAVPSSPPAAKGGLRVFYDTQAAATSPLARFLGQPATADCSKDNNNNSNIQTCNLLAHLRYATTGSAANLANVHPFVREMWALNWCFCHNGQIPLFEDHPTHCLLGDDPSLSPSQQQQRYYYPVGETDSEMAFCAILNAIRNRFPDTMPSLPDLYSTIHSLCREIVEYNPQSTIMNFLLTCGPHVLWVYSWPGQRPGSAVWNGLHYLVLPSSSASSQKDTKDLCDGDISVRLQGRRHGNNGNNEDETDNMCFVATKPLTNDTEWIEMKAGELIVLDKGIPYVTARDLFHIELRGHGLDNSNKALQPPRLEEDMRRYQFDPSFYVGGGI